MGSDTPNRDSERKHDDPQQVVTDPSLSYGQKIDLLEEWQVDLLELQRATDENMPPANAKSGEVGDKLHQIHQALMDLRRLHGKADDA